MTVIAIGSQSEIKMEAVKIACQCVRIKAEIVAIPASSGVSAQPNGIEETGRGAQNRARAASAERPDAWALGIESGITRSDNGRWVDIAAIALIEPNGREWLVWSDSVEFPADDVLEALARGPETTVGDVIAERTGCAPHDPHFFLTGQERSRIDYLADAVEKIFRFVGLHRTDQKEIP